MSDEKSTALVKRLRTEAGFWADGATRSCLLDAAAALEASAQALKSQTEREGYEVANAERRERTVTARVQAELDDLRASAQAPAVPSDAALVDQWWKSCEDRWAVPDEVMVKFGRDVLARWGAAAIREGRA